MDEEFLFGCDRHVACYRVRTVTNLLHRLTISFLLLASLAMTGCTTLTTGKGLRLRVTITAKHSPLESAELGALYIEDRACGPDLRVGIRRDQTWTIATELEPGWFTLGMRSGKIKNGVALDFPTDLLHGRSERLHTEGDIRAWLGSRPIQHSAPRAADAELTE